MTLYYWRSKTLENYARGHIIVEAPGVPEARHKATLEFEKFMKEHYYWDDEIFENSRASFQQDLEGDYEELEVLLITGSE